MASSPYVTDDLELLLEIQTAAEQRLNAQLTAALAADQRALIFAGFVTTGAVALTSAAVSILIGTGADPYLGRLALGAAIGMAIALALAIQAARPTLWYFPGGRPENWTADIAAGTPRAERLQQLVADYDDRIAHNDGVMKRNGRLRLASTVLVFVTLLASAIILAVHIW